MSGIIISCLSIPNFQEKYKISCSYHKLNIKWETERSKDEIIKLHKFLSQKDTNTPNFDEFDAETLEIWLNSLLDYYQEKIWDHTSFIEFLDNIPIKSNMTLIRFDRMSSEILSLREKSDSMESKLIDVENKASMLFDIMFVNKQGGEVKVSKNPSSGSNTLNQSQPEATSPSLTAKNLEQYTISLTPLKRTKKIHQRSSNNSSNNNSFNKLSFTSAVTSGSAVSHMASFGSMFHTHIPDIPDEYVASSSDDDASVYSVARSINSTNVDGVLGDGKTASSKRSFHKKNRSPTQGNDQFGRPPIHNSPSKPQIDPSGAPVNQQARLALLEHTSSDNSIPGVTGGASKVWGNMNDPVLESEFLRRLPNWSILSPELIPNNEIFNFLNQPIDELVHAIQPHEEQLQYRASATCVLRKQIRKALSSNTFEIGFHAVHCFLPDDPIKLSVAVSKTRLSDWHKSLIEQLNSFSEKSNSSSFFEEEMDVDILDDSRPITNHSISNLSFSSYNLNFRVLLNIDATDVEVVSNSRSELCLLAFFEEISKLIGQDHLFKRSMLLIRAWWNYETAGYVGSSIKHYLSDNAIGIMICAIFNKYHRNIVTPLQALSLFIAEYADYDGNCSAITLQGIVPFKSESSNQPVLNSIVNAAHLFPLNLLDKYWQAFNISQTTDEVDEQSSFLKLVSSSSEDGGTQRSSAITNALNTNASLAALRSFERTGFNVIHPFTLGNMITDKISSRRVAKLTQAFQSGANHLKCVLQSPCGDLQQAYTRIKDFFPATLSKYSDSSRPDTLQNCIQLNFENRNIRHLMNASMERICQNIQYFDLVLESLISEYALYTVSFEILADKGPLPVGEVGKVLTEFSSNPNLSLKLKESFGGLKKFLERYPDKFVVVNDHPFNPHVLLKQTLTLQQLDMISKGIMPPQLTSKGKRQSASKKKSGKGFNSNNSSMQSIPSNSSSAQNLHNSMIESSSHHSSFRGNLLSAHGAPGSVSIGPPGNMFNTGSPNNAMMSGYALNNTGMMNNNINQPQSGSNINNNLSNIAGLVGHSSLENSNNLVSRPLALSQQSLIANSGFTSNLLSSASSDMTFDSSFNGNPNNALSKQQRHSFHGMNSDTMMEYQAGAPPGLLSTSNLVVGSGVGQRRSPSGRGKSDSDLLNPMDGDHNMRTAPFLRNNPTNLINSAAAQGSRPSLTTAAVSMQQQQQHMAVRGEQQRLQQQQQQLYHSQQFYNNVNNNNSNTGNGSIPYRNPVKYNANSNINSNPPTVGFTAEKSQAQSSLSLMDSYSSRVNSDIFNRFASRDLNPNFHGRNTSHSDSNIDLTTSTDSNLGGPSAHKYGGLFTSSSFKNSASVNYLTNHLGDNTHNTNPSFFTSASNEN